MKLLYLLFAFFISCSTEPEDIYGCTFKTACNFNPNANIYDDTCEYESCLGCDGIINSGLIIDDCGECGGDNLTCEDYNLINMYELEDLNANSSTFGQTLNHNTFLGKAILYYFPISDT